AAEHPAEASEAISQQAQAAARGIRSSPRVLNFPPLRPVRRRCSHCATHFLDVCEAMPPQTKSREDYAVPLPDLRTHNKVNEALMNQRLGLTIDERGQE
ncbi:hypothetical protein AK812_SmicGene45389, partial [Symbiodinium microadriaticum]